MQEKIIELLGSGLSPTTVAAAVGCTPSYITQLLSQEEIAKQVAELRIAATVQYVEHDKKVDSLEENALKKMHQLLPMVTRPMEALRIFQIANAAKRKTEGADAAAHRPVAQVVNINIPAAAAVAFKLSPDRQVVEIEGRSATSMSAQELNRQLAARRQQLLDSGRATTLLSTPIPVEEVKTIAGSL